MINTNNAGKELTGYPSIDKPWLKYYPEYLLSQKYQCEKIIDKLRSVWKDDETIIIYYDTEITTKDFFERVNIVSKSLTSLGITEGDSIALSLESVPEFLELFLACEIIGCSIKNFIEPITDSIDLIKSCSSKIYFTHDYISESDTKNIYNQTHIKNIVVINPLFSATNKEGVRDNIKSVIDKRYMKSSRDNRNIPWQSFLQKGSSGSTERIKNTDNILFSAFTSGTSGKPKEVLHTSKTLMGVINQLALFPSHEKGKDTWLLTILPPSLVAVVVAMMFYPLADGKTLILDPFCNIGDLDLEMMHYKPNCWGLIPIFFNSILESNRIPKNYDMSYFKLFGFGAEPMTQKFIMRVQEFLDSHNCQAPLSSGYGQSEGGSDFTVCIGREMIMSGSAGIPLIDTTISIFEQGTTKELKYYGVGEICKNGLGIMLGYSDPKLTDEVLRTHPDGNLWLHTGDFGYITEEGLLYVLGRSKINVFPGKDVFAVRITNKLSAIDGVKDLVVVAGKDIIHDGFEAPYLFIIPEDNQDILNVLNNLNEMISANLLPEEVPTQIFVIDKKPIKHFKTDIRSLQEKYNFV